MLVMIEPALPHRRNRDGLKAQRRGRANFELGIDLRSHLAGGFASEADTGLLCEDVNLEVGDWCDRSDRSQHLTSLHFVACYSS